MEPITNDDLLYIIDNYNSLVVENVKINKKNYCKRLIFHKKYIDDSYNITYKIGNIEIIKTTLKKWSFLEIKDNQYILNLDEYINQKLIGHNHCLKIIDPASNNNWPLFDLARNIGYGSKLIIFYDSKFKEPHNYFDSGLQEQNENIKELKAINEEIGLNILKFPWLENSTIIILPYENATISHWKLFKQTEGWEGLRCTLKFDDILHPFPQYILKCRLFNKEKECLYEKTYSVLSNDKLIFDFLPVETNSFEIFKVEIKLFENDKLIDDKSGYPVRNIKINFHINDN